ncbi:MAG TPA: hypothetical protein VF369_08245, partial [candidate division Zixibacteria bacterium]
MLSKISILLFLILIFSSYSHAQMISSEIYETEEDLQEGLESGALTFEQYLELLDLIQNKVMPLSPEADKLFSIPDISGIDILQVEAKSKEIDLGQRLDAFLETKENNTDHLLSGKAAWRFYQKFHEQSEAENLFSCSVTDRKNITGYIETAQRAGTSGSLLTTNDMVVRRRFLAFQFSQYKTNITLGNFDKRIGWGLNVGYHYLFGYSDDTDLKIKNSFLYPSRGRYNGILVESALRSFSVMAFYSKNRQEQIADQIGALDVSWASKSANMGLCLSQGELRNVNGKGNLNDDCGSLHFDFKLQSLRLSGEYALLSNQTSGMALDIYSYRRKFSFDFSGWRYQDGFIHPHGGGISNPDYESIYLEKIDYSYKSRQAGERGILFKSRYRMMNKLSIYFSFNQWRERSYLQNKMRLKIGTGYDFSKKLALLVSHQWSDSDMEDEIIDQDVTTLDLFFSPGINTDFNLITNYRKTENKDYGDLRLKINTLSVPPFNFTLWIKYNDPNFSHTADEYFSFHFQERVEIFENCFASVEFITKFYQD